MKAWTRKLRFSAIFSIFSVAITLPGLTYGDCSGPGNNCVDGRLEIGYSNGDFIGLKDAYGEADLFVPLPFLDKCFSFIDARGYRFNDNLSGASLGLGFRCCGLDIVDDRVWGANIFWDYRQGTLGEYFTRVGIGLEWLGNWDFRINGYIPTGTQIEHSREAWVDSVSGFEVECDRYEYSTSGGFDMEVGAPIGRVCNYWLYGATGPYFFTGAETTGYFGMQARLELHWKSFLSFQVRTSWDSKNQSQTQGTIFIILPFELFANWCCLCTGNLGLNPYTKKVQRIGTIFMHRKGCNDNWYPIN